MDRSELYMLNVYKGHELEKRLEPIIDAEWGKIKENDLIWHKDSNNIKGFDFFKGISDEHKDIVIYKNQDGEVYDRSKSGWYHYNANIAEDVENYWTPKLWSVINKNSKDTLYIVACNENHLLSCLNEEYDYEIPKQEFNKKFEIKELIHCGDFKIMLK